LRYVIIGGSIAGSSAARAIRSCGSDADIMIISDEKAQPYCRPMIPAKILKQDADIGLGNGFDPRSGIRTIHARAASLNRLAKEVTFSSGDRVRYDKLLIATGSSAVIPDLPGLAGNNVFALRTLDDALAIQADARQRKHAVVLGGGFVGIEAAITLRRLGLNVSIIEKLGRILSEKLDKRASAIVSGLLKQAGIDILANQQDYEIERVGGTVRSVRLASGRIIDADLIVVAVGTRPNTDVFRNSGLAINKGIVIHESLQTSDPDVYAAGDVVEYRDILSNTVSVCGLWSNAEEMGRLAGCSMTGSNVKYSGFLSLMNTVKILDVPVTAIGMVDPVDTGYDLFIEEKDGAYRKLVFKNEVLKGALFINSTEKSEAYAYLIKNQIPLGNMKKLAIQGGLGDIEFLKTQAHTPVS
jgi:nitrite reductase (NADH) large subunit